MTIKSLLVKIGADVSEFKTAMDGVKSKTAAVGKDLSSMGKTLSLGVSLPLLGVGVAATKMAMDAVESENLFEVSMGSMAEAARAWSDEISSSLGLNQYEVRKTVGTFNVMLTSMGQNEQAAFGMSKGLSQLVYDMSSFYNLRPEEAFEKLQAGISGEIEPLKRLGIVIRETDVEAYALKNGIAANSKELTDAQKVQIRYNLILERTKAAQGDLARTIDSPSNQFRLLKSRVSEMLVEFGQKLLPVFNAGLSVLRGVADAFSGMSDGAKTWLVVALGVTAAIGPMLFGFGKILQVLPAIKAAVIATSGSFGAFAMSAVPLAALALAAGKLIAVMTDLRNATEAADQAEARFNEQNAKLGQKLRETADSVGMTRAAFAQLTQKYGENYAAMAMAIKKGQEGKELQEALAAAGAKRVEALEKERQAQEQLRSEEESAAERTRKEKEAKEEYAKKVKEIYERLPEVVKSAKDEEMRATLTEYEYSKWALDQKYKDALAAIPKEVAATAQGQAALLALKQSHLAQMTVLEQEHRNSELLARMEFAKLVADQEDAAILAKVEREATYNAQLSELIAARNELTMGELEYSLWAIEQERAAKVAAITSSSQFDTEQKAALLAAAQAFYDSKRKMAEDDANFELALTKQLTTDMSQAFGDFAGDALQAFADWGAGSSTILEGLGKAFQGLARTAMSALSSLVSAIVAEAIKSVAASQIKAIGGIIASVMTSVPFPLNLALVGGAIAGVTALFSGIKLAEGGLVTRPTYALVGEAGPELVVPYDKVESFWDRGGSGEGMNFHQTVHFHGDIKTDLDIDQVSEKLARKTREAIMRGRR